MTHLSATRRHFLAGATAAATFRPAMTAADAPDDIRLGVCSYSVRNFPRTEAIAMIKQLNVREVSIKEMHLLYKSTPEQLAAGRKEFEDAGLKIASGGVVYMQKDDEADIRSYFEYAKACGMPMMVIGAIPQNLPKIEKCVKEYGIAVAVHNHGPEDKIFPTPQSALKHMGGMDPRVGVCIDVGHTVRTGVDLIQTIREAGPRLLDFHIKDLRDLHEKGSQCPVGDGAMPIVAIFRELKRMKFRGLVGLEYEIDAKDPLAGMQKSFAYMRGVLAGLRS